MIRSLRSSRWICAGVIGIAVLIAYSGGWNGPFVFDGDVAITNNPTIRHLWPLTAVLRPPTDGSPVSGRPLTNLSFALNYAAGGLHVFGYHAVNLTLHLGAALLLFGILRRTRLPFRQGFGGRDEGEASQLVPAAIAALLWSVHPLLTGAVTYVAQRSELLMGVCYLGTLYAFIRGATAPSGSSSGWYGLSCAACLAGMAAKEVMVTAPVLVLLYDRTFLTGTFTAAWRQRRLYYTAVGATWLLLAYLFFGSGTRGGTIGFATVVPWTSYALMQLRAVTHYLRLVFWPNPLVLDYGLRVSGFSLAVLADLLLLLVLGGLSVVALGRRHAAGYWGAWFFLILGPTSSVVPVATEITAEHRMYLPLAAVITLLVGAAFRWLPRCAGLALGAVAVGLIAVTVARNRDYRSAVALWQQTTTAVPTNAGAHNNLASALLAERRQSEAVAEFNAALRLDPSLAGTHNNLGQVLLLQNQPAAAAEQFDAALRLAPRYPEARTGLAFADFALGNQAAAQNHLSDAIQAFQASVALDPQYAEALGNLGGALVSAHRPAEAVEPCQAALRLKPDLLEAQINLANALLELGRPQEAIAAYRRAIAVRPDNPTAHHNLAAALHAVGQDDEARAELKVERNLRAH